MERAALLSLAETATPILLSFMFYSTRPDYAMLCDRLAELKGFPGGDGATRSVQPTSNPFVVLREW